MKYVTQQELDELLAMDRKDKIKYLIKNCGVNETDLILDFLIYYDIN